MSNMEGHVSPSSAAQRAAFCREEGFDKQWRIRENNINKMFNSAALLHGDLISIAGKTYGN